MLPLSPTNEALHLLSDIATDMDTEHNAHVPIRLLYGNHRENYRQPRGDAVRGGLAHRGHSKALWHRDLHAAVLLALLHHSHLLFVHLLQAAEQQEASVEEQELEEEDHM